MDGRTRVLAVAAVIAALAVGILVGSSPLRSLITGGPSSEADELRTELEDATAAAKDAQEAAAVGEDFAAATAPILLAGSLEGRVVALVRTSDATDDDVAAASAHLADTGVVVGAEAALTEDWTSEDRAPFRDALAEQITSSLTQEPTGATTEQVLAAALAQALAPGIAAGTDLVGAQASERADTLWTLLTEAGLVTGARTAPVDTFVLVTASGEPELAHAFADTSAGTVVGYTGTDRADGGGASSVTRAANPWGALAVAGALAAAAQGSDGDFDAADAPELVAAANEY